MKRLSRITDGETNAIAEVIEKFQSAWNQKDVDGMVALFTDDAEFTDIRGQIALGKAKVKAMHEFAFQKVMKGAKLNVDSIYIRDISNKQVLVTGKWSTDGHADFSGKEMPQRRGVIQFICMLVDESNWRISLVYNTDFTQQYVQSSQHELAFFE